MAQQLLDELDFVLNPCVNITNINVNPKRTKLVCFLDNGSTMINVKRWKKDIKIIIEDCNETVHISVDLLRRLIDLKESLYMLVSFIQGDNDIHIMGSEEPDSAKVLLWNNQSELIIYEKRLETFFLWPQQMRPDKYELAKAGFFYTKEGDVVKCFSCGVTINHWLSTDSPLAEHHKWSPDCAFLKMIGYGVSHSVYNGLGLNPIGTFKQDLLYKGSQKANTYS